MSVAFAQASITFIGQNYGAGNMKRVRQTLKWGLLYVLLAGGILGNLVVLFRVPLLKLYVSEADSIAYGSTRIIMINTLYFLCGTMDVTVGALRGVGFSLIPMFVSLIGVCGFRVVWIFPYFRTHHTMEMLFISYPISWVATFLCQLLVFMLWVRSTKRKGIA